MEELLVRAETTEYVSDKASDTEEVFFLNLYSGGRVHIGSTRNIGHY
jgi:hypothetical protein